jgi:medium-chain acyl-[acyl-carrier-protein] hydrolase
MLETYRAEPELPLSMPIVAYGALNDQFINPWDIASWGSATTGNFRLRYFPGDHYFLKSVATDLFADLASDLPLKTGSSTAPAVSAAA